MLHRGYTDLMPTARARHMITETPDVAASIDVAAHAWPDAAENRAELLRRLVDRGRQAIETDVHALVERRLQAIDELAGTCVGVYPPDAAEQLKADWPE